MIDPQKIEGRIFISDNSTPGFIQGTHFLEAIGLASVDLDEERKPEIISLMASNVDYVYNTAERMSEWQRLSIDAVDKGEYAIAVMWVGHRLGVGGGLSFSEYFKQVAGFDYFELFRNRRDFQHRVADFNNRFLSITDVIREGLPEEQQGILLRLPIDEHRRIAGGEYKDMKWQEVPSLLAEWNVKYPDETQLGELRKV